LRRRLSGRLGSRGLAERLGRGPAQPPAPGRVTLWIHGASNGELTSARWLMQRLLARSPALHLVVTSDTETARNMVESWGEARISASLAPLDYRWALARFLNRVRPRALVILENELWPNRIVMAAARGIPVLMLGARISERSARPWARVPRLAARLMAGLRYLSAQDPGSEDRFRAMGLPADRLGPRMNLKSQAEEGALPDLPEDLLRLFQRERTLLAASTHPGEEALLLAAFARLRAEGLYDRLILAPRHPRRSAEVAAAIAAAGLAHTTRSAGEGPAEQAATAPVYLADTMGEMSLWYRLAGVTFLGGSLLPGPGGHNPYEPARFDTALV
ncbi:3-deoxy-D-manno-octulosonic acid transferase, partial [Thioclava sp. BHET1]